MIELTQNYLKELFDYRNGNLYWKVRKSYRIKIGDIGGYVRKDGYRHVGIDDKDYKSHRLIFLYHHGYLPKSLDHIDGNKSNNDIDNLRCATNQENAMNQKRTNHIMENRRHRNLKAFHGISVIKNGRFELWLMVKRNISVISIRKLTPLNLMIVQQLKHSANLQR